MTTKRGRGSGDVPLGADDFERIPEIDSSIKNRLYAVSIYTFEDLAALTPKDLARSLRLAGISAELISGQDWIGQARTLADMRPQADVPSDTLSSTALQPDEMNSAIRLHPATFTIELQLHEDNVVHHTRVTHLQSESKDSWANWEEARLVGFLVEHAELRLPPAQPVAAAPIEPPAPVEPAPAAAEPVPAVAAPLEPVPAVVAPLEPVPAVAAVPVEPAPAVAEPAPLVAAVPVEPAPAVAEPAPAVAAAPVELAPVPQPVVTSGRTDVLHLRAIEAVPAGTDEPSRVLQHDQPFGVRLTFDLAGVAISGNMPLHYTAAIYTKSMSGRLHQAVGEARGTIASAHTVVVNIAGKALSPGNYRLEATVALTMPSAPPSRPGPVALIESGVLQVY